MRKGQARWGVGLWLLSVLVGSCGLEGGEGFEEGVERRGEALEVGGLVGQYFDNADFTALKATRNDATIHFNWGTTPPAGLTSIETFSVRWTGRVKAPVTGLYTFTTNTDDGVRLWVGGQPLINDWTEHSATERTGSIHLSAGQFYDVQMDFYENLGVAVAQLSWAYPGQVKQIVPASALSHVEADGPAPTLTAPPLDTSVPTEFHTATSFLFTGTGAVQTGVVAGAIEARRQAVAFGKVQSRTGAAVSGVKVTVLGHPEWGQTLSRTDGAYDMAFNGGGRLTFQFEKTGFLPVQRSVETPWQDWVSVPLVMLTPLDAAVTVVTPNAAAFQTARATAVTDADGARQATLLVPPGTTASMKLPNGSTQALSTLSIRATEYTVGATGPASMPGTLPSSSAYTYAVEWSVDEARAVNATTVTFSQPVYFYLDNFIGFPVGIQVPTGYYDRQAGVWKADTDGRVIKVVAVVSGLAQVDVTGDGVADTGAVLTALGFTDAERQRLGALYAAGKTLWRVPLTHFTPWDCNWGVGFPAGATFSPNAGPTQDGTENKPCNVNGSIIECENQTLGEVLPVTGTPYALYYRSDRVPGRKTELSFEVPLTDATYPDKLKVVALRVTGAGREWYFEYTPAPNKRVTFAWDGKDAWGRRMQGRFTFKVEVGFGYSGVYRKGMGGGGGGNPSFALRGGDLLATGNRASNVLFLWRKWTQWLAPYDATAHGGLGAWTMDVHHAFQQREGRLFRGDAGRQSVEATGAVLELYAAGGQGLPVDGGSAMTPGFTTNHLTAGPDGSLYATESQNGMVWRISPQGTIHAFAGNLARVGCPNPAVGLGGPANQASLCLPTSTALGPDGSLYIAAGKYLYRVTPDGILRPFAGNGLSGTVGTEGEGGPATSAALGQVGFVKVDADNNVWLSTNDNGSASLHRIRRISPAGTIATVVGNGTSSVVDGPIAATEAGLPGATRAAGFDSTGGLILSGQTDYRIRRLDTEGRLTKILGTGVAGYSGDDGPAPLATLKAMLGPGGMAVGPGDELYVLDTARLRYVGTDGLVSTLAGDGTVGNTRVKANVLQSPFNFSSIAVAPNGTVFLAGGTPTNRIYRLRTPLDGFSASETLVPSEDGTEAFVFQGGRHLRTVHALTGATLLTLGYTSTGKLASLTDANGQVTRIERDAAGSPLALVAPNGQRTGLAVSAGGYMVRVTNPANESHLFQYSTEGLITGFTDTRGFLHTFEYDAKGRLTKDTDAGGGFKTLARRQPATGAGSGKSGYVVDVATAEGRARRVTSERVGSVKRRTLQSPAGLTTLIEEGTNGSTKTTSPDGTVETLRYGEDARLGVSAPFLSYQATTLPSGLTRTFTQSQSVARAAGDNPDNPFAFTTATWTATLNGKTQSTVFTQAARRFTHTSPMGKKASLDVDTQGRVTRAEVPGLTPVTYSYLPSGQLSAVTQGARQQTFAYQGSGATQGWLASTTDALSRVTSFQKDAVGRTTSVVLPGSRTVGASYDASGNLLSLTPPGKPAHRFLYRPNDTEESYTPPSVSGAGSLSTLYGYNRDEELTLASFPDGTNASFTYDTGGRLKVVTTPRHSVTATYSATTGQLTSLIDSATDGASLAYAYDGPLVTQVAWSGGVTGSVESAYNAHFQRTSVSVNGANPVAYTYDADQLLSAAGALTLSRNTQNGLLTGTTLGSVTTTHGFNAFGEVASFTAAAGATSLYSATLSARDNAGRLTQRVESVLGGASQTWGYGYDAAGRLQSVTLNGAAYASYGYDAQGNRTSKTEGGVTTAATYDAQDRLLTLGTASYAYGARGNLTTKTVGAAVTRYTYDTHGALTAVQLPTGTSLAYVHDATGRRVGKKVAGVLTQRFLYDGALRVVAELDGAGALVSRFVYGTQGHVPDYLVKGGVTYRLVTDERGSVRLVVNSATGAVAQRMDYDAWGRVLGDTAPGFQPFGFAGGLYDRDTQLTRFGARDYDAEAGRWTAKDPIRFAGGDSNLYAYVGGDPVNAIDPSGLHKADKWFDDYPKAFKKWFHRKWKQEGNPDANAEEQAEAFEEWKHRGKPRSDNKGAHRGDLDADIFGLAIGLVLPPWLDLDPSELACAEMDCNHNGIPDWEEQSDKNQCGQ